MPGFLPEIFFGGGEGEGKGKIYFYANFSIALIQNFMGRGGGAKVFQGWTKHLRGIPVEESQISYSVIYQTKLSTNATTEN